MGKGLAYYFFPLLCMLENFHDTSKKRSLGNIVHQYRYVSMDWIECFAERNYGWSRICSSLLD